MTPAPADSVYLEQLEAVATGLERLPSGFRLGGREHSDLFPAHLVPPGRDAALESLVALLYSQVYSRADEYSGTEAAAPAHPDEKAAFLAALSGSNLTEELSDPGWQVQAAPAGGLLTVARNGVTKYLPPGRYLPAGAERVGESVQRFQPKESMQLQAGFYYAFSEAEFEYAPTVLRFYWHIRAGGAAPLVRAVTQHLNRYRVPFLFKCLEDPQAYVRRDAAVLFVRRQYVHVCGEVLPALLAATREWRRHDVPLLTLPLAPGLGFAENPAGISSFGLNRMHLVARGLLQALRENAGTARARVGEVVRQFAAHGIDAGHPYLNPGSDPAYVVPLRSRPADGA